MDQEWFLQQIQLKSGIKNQDILIRIYEDAWRLGWQGGVDEVMKIALDLAKIELEAV